MGCESCTDCCKAIGINRLSDQGIESLKNSGSIPQGWVKITKRQAKKRNPHMFKMRWGGSKTYFRCTHLTDQGCSIHQESPYVCSGYPYYGHSLDESRKRAYMDEYLYEYSKDGCNLRKELQNIETEVQYDNWVKNNFTNFTERFKGSLHKSLDKFGAELIPSVDITDL